MNAPIGPGTRNWGTALAYVAFIYATLSYTPTALLFLRSRNLLRVTLFGLEITAFLAVVIVLIRNHRWNVSRLIILMSLIPVYYLLGTRTKRPEEQVHFFEYGLVGIFFLRALDLKQCYKARSYLMALLLASLAGVIDEILQGCLPNRHFDMRDIYLNIVSSALGLVMFAVIRKPHSASLQEKQ